MLAAHPDAAVVPLEVQDRAHTERSRVEARAVVAERRLDDVVEPDGLARMRMGRAPRASGTVRCEFGPLVRAEPRLPSKCTLQTSTERGVPRAAGLRRGRGSAARREETKRPTEGERSDLHGQHGRRRIDRCQPRRRTGAVGRGAGFPVAVLRYVVVSHAPRKARRDSTERRERGSSFRPRSLLLRVQPVSSVPSVDPLRQRPRYRVPLIQPMKAFVITSPGTIETGRPAHARTRGDCLIGVRNAGICGTDPQILEGYADSPASPATSSSASSSRRRLRTPPRSASASSARSTSGAITATGAPRDQGTLRQPQRRRHPPARRGVCRVPDAAGSQPARGAGQHGRRDAVLRSRWPPHAASSSR